MFVSSQLGRLRVYGEISFTGALPENALVDTSLFLISAWPASLSVERATRRSDDIEQKPRGWQIQLLISRKAFESDYMLLWIAHLQNTDLFRSEQGCWKVVFEPS